MLEIIVDIIVWLLLLVFIVSWGFIITFFYVIWKLSPIDESFPYIDVDNDEEDYYIINKNDT
jgi:hypothetical protein